MDHHVVYILHTVNYTALISKQTENNKGSFLKAAGMHSENLHTLRQSWSGNADFLKYIWLFYSVHCSEYRPFSVILWLQLSCLKISIG